MAEMFWPPAGVREMSQSASVPSTLPAASMTRRRVLMAVAGGAVAAGAGILPASASSKYGIIGREAPAIEAESWIDRHGDPTTFHMSELDNRWVLLKCFQSWCPGCHSHGLPTLKKVADRFADHEHVVLLGLQTVFEGFNSNTLEKVRETQLQYELPIKMGHNAGNPDGDHRPVTMRRYRTGGTPWMVIIDPAGKVVYNNYSLNADRFIAYLQAQLG